MMPYNDEIKTMLLEWKQAFEIEKAALKSGMINLERDGVFKVIKWLLSMDQVFKFVKWKSF
jgi:type II secretory ATPase GspE/PulE/Tfp pilus assembly ATPase PilB-like protein